MTTEVRALSHRKMALQALIGALAISTVAIEAPAEAQRSSSRARRARARRARLARIARQNRLAQSAPVDMDFTTPLVAMDDERPPPMDVSYVREHEARTLERRRAALDPELFGEANRERTTVCVEAILLLGRREGRVGRIIHIQDRIPARRPEHQR